MKNKVTTISARMDQNTCSIRMPPPLRKPCRLDWAQSSWTRWFHVLFWWWLNPLLKLSQRQKITDDDLFDLSANDKCEELSENFENMWKAYEQNHEQVNVWKIIAKTFWKQTLRTGLILIPYFAAKIAQPVLLKGIVTNINDPHASSYISYLYAVGLGLTKMLLVFIHHQFFFRTARTGMRIRISLAGFIYKRLLSTPVQAIRSDMTTGYLINLISNDISKFEGLYTYIHHFWAGPIQALVIFALVWYEIGISTIFGYTVLFLQIPLQLYFGKKFRTYRQNTMKCSDQRVKMVSEILMGGEILKMYRWEEAFESVVKDLRHKEFCSIRKANRIRALNMAIHFFSLSLVSLATFGGSWLMGETLSSVKIFTVLSFFGIMREPLTIGFPYAIETISECAMASTRIDKFLNLSKQIKIRKSISNLEADRYLTGTIIIRKASFSWNLNESAQLFNIDFNLKAAALHGIIGPIGSGKSSLLAAILGEMHLIEGHRKVYGKIAYVSQTPWIFTGTIRENILFYQPYHHEKYERVIKACCLITDFQSFSAADQMVIGEKGVNLSGGQKARVSLARALYTDADIYLFDDPLAALDLTVATQIFKNCISNTSILSNKTRVLVTHQLQFVPEFDHCILLKDGRIDKQGLSNVLATVKCISSFDQRKQMKNDDSTVLPERHDKHSIITEETSNDGRVARYVWLRLLTVSNGSIGLILLIILIIISQGLHDAANKWLSIWSSKSVEEQRHSRDAYIYLSLSIGTCIIAVCRADFFFYLILQGASFFHAYMFKGVLYSSLRFYESNPIGRILNRFSKDQQVLDELLPVAFFDAIQALIIVLGSIVIIGIANPWVLLTFLILIPVFIWLRRTYLRLSREVKRLDSVSRSPIYALFSSSLSGLITIRAFQAENHFVNSFYDRINTNTRALFIFICSSRWFGLRLDLLTCALTFVTGIVSVAIRNNIDPASLALGLVYVINLSEVFQWGVRQSAETENHMISAERIDEYTRIPPECGFYEDEFQPTSGWPTTGKIEFDQFQLRYRTELPPVLKGMNLVIEAGKKIGIIGRTGSGKSSIFQALFRLTDRSTTNGQIFIDGININRISLNNLRSSLNIIPQSPVLFSNTIRYNLDPVQQYSDEQLWEALDAVQLKAKIYHLKDQLLTEIAEYGNNFSVGECQLICIARAILKRSKILLIDEATAHVDKDTDEIIQRIVREKFKDQTILTIAHRLNTIADSDRILVMNDGVIVTYGKPADVLTQDNYLLYNIDENEYETYL